MATLRSSSSWLRVSAIVAVAGVLAICAEQGRASEAISCVPTGTPNQIHCRIDQPNVTTSAVQYPTIRFQVGDTVVVSAGGCAQTGGAGATWKLYVNPAGPNSDRLYHGLISIPGATGPGLVRLSTVVGRQLTIPTGVSTAALYLTLGYEDDDYGDNGYWGHDDGTGNQCRGVGDAYVDLLITHATAVPPSPTTTPAPFDLVGNSLDQNGIPQNPQWGYQVTHPGGFPDASSACQGFPISSSGAVSIGSPPCTTQPLSFDTPTGWNGFWCNEAGNDGHVNGHVNWGPATYDGTLFWESHSAPGTDDDYNFKLLTPNAAGLTQADLSSGMLQLEFDSDETIDHFNTSWWNSFHQAVDSSDAAAQAMVNFKQAIVSGLMGLDNEHSAGAELHPVYAMALDAGLLPGDSANEDNWAMFVRNWGDEGYCSSLQHYLELTQYTFSLPWRAGATGVTVVNGTGKSQFLTNSSAVEGPDVTAIPGQAVLVTFHLPDPSAGARVNGNLDLLWSYPPVAKISSTVHVVTGPTITTPSGAKVTLPAHSTLTVSPSRFPASVMRFVAGQVPDDGDPEGLLADRIAKLSASQRTSIAAIQTGAAHAATKDDIAPGHVQVTKAASLPPVPRAIPRVVTAIATAANQVAAAIQHTLCSTSLQQTNATACALKPAPTFSPPRAVAPATKSTPILLTPSR